MMMELMKGEWSTLSDDLLQDIADRVAVDAVEDYIRFRAVCTSWRSATVDPRRHRRIPPQLPWLMLTFDEAFDGTRSFYRRSDDKIITLDLPEVLNYRILGSSDGWLVLVHESGALRLFNPLTKAQVSLPALTTLPWVVSYRMEDVDEEFALDFGLLSSWDSVRDCFVNKVITLTEEEGGNGSGGGGPVILVAMLFFFGLVFARVGDDKWTVVDDSLEYQDILFYRGRLYAVDRFRVIVAADISRGPSNISFTTLDSARDGRDGFLWYLTLTEDDQGLLLVGRYYGERHRRAFKATKSFEVFRVDDLDGDLNVTRVNSLGDWALFLGTNRAMSFNVKDANHRGWKNDCIYFTQSVSDSKAVGPYQEVRVIEVERVADDFGVFNLKDASIEPLPHCPGGSLVVWPQPIWFSPNVRHQTPSSDM